MNNVVAKARLSIASLGSTCTKGGTANFQFALSAKRIDETDLNPPGQKLTTAKIAVNEFKKRFGGERSTLLNT